MTDDHYPKLGDLFQPVDRSWLDAMSDESKIAYFTYLRDQIPRAIVYSDEIWSEGVEHLFTEATGYNFILQGYGESTLTGTEAIEAMNSPMVERWYLD